jgi:oligopeptide transport system permease protein
MVGMILWRLAQLPVVLGVIFVVTFTLAWVLPGDPLLRPEGKRPSVEVQLAMRQQYRLDNPVAFAAGYLKDVFTKLDFGPSLQYRDQRVSDILWSGLPVSAALGVASMIVALVLGIGAGVAGALRPGSAWEWSSLLMALVGVSLPAFVTGSVLLVIFAGLLGVLPASGWGTPGHLLLPAITLGLGPAAYIARLVRLGLAEVMNSDFIRTARAKGLDEGKVVMHHAMKVAFLPVLSFLGPAAATAMTGGFVVEKVFAVPGMGEHFVNAVLNKDQFLVLGVVLVYSTILIVFNLAVDVAYAWVDPRISV